VTGATSSVESEGLYGFLFQCGKQAVLVAWADLEVVGPGWRLRCTSGEPVSYDIMGNRIASREIVLTGSPVYLVSKALSPEALAKSCSFLPPAK
jgi:hypothetical protein